MGFHENVTVGWNEFNRVVCFQEKMYQVEGKQVEGFQVDILVTWRDNEVVLTSFFRRPGNGCKL